MYYGIINSMNKTSAPSYTARTTALITATGISNTILINAINTLDLGIISNSIPFSSNDALYLGTLGSNSANTYNFIDTTKYQLTLSGGWTSTTGLKGSSNAIATTGWIPSARISNVNNGTWGFYARNAINTNLSSEIIFSRTPSTNSFGLLYYYGTYPMIQNDSFNVVSPYRLTGMFQASRTSSTNTSFVATQTNYSITQVAVGLSTAQVSLGASGYYTSLDYCCTYLSANQWTLAQKQTFETLVTAFLTSLSLNV